MTPAVARALEERIRSAGQRAEFHVYPGAGRAFANDSRPDAHQPEAARDAWRRTLDFFRRELR